MKKIIGLVLSLVLLTSVFAALPTMAADEATITDVAVHLDQGITLVYKLSDGGYENVPVAAKEMNKVAAPAGYTEGATSVKAYAVKLLGMEDTSDITKALVNAMLNYGAAAQNYFGYETDNLVGTPVTDTSALEAAVAPDVVVNDDEGIYLGASLILEGTLKLRFYFEGNDLEVECDNNTPAVTNVGDICYLDVPFMPYDVAEPITVTTGTTSVSYAPINYLKAKVNDADEKLTTMVASIYAYSVAARTYYIEYNCEHRGITLKATTVPTIFTEGLASGICPDCGKDVTKVLPVNTPTVTKVDYVLKEGETNKKNEAPVVRESMQLSEVLGEGEHFYPTNANPEGKSLYIEFSMLLNETMNNFVNTNMTFPGIYTADSLAADKGESAFWFFLKDDYVDQGGFDDWTSNAVDKDNPDMYYNNQTALAFDGWHRFGFEFHQNTTINGDNVTYTVTVSMYVDGVKVYEAVLGKDSNRTESILLYTAEVVDGQTIYTDRADAYAAFFRYTMYVSDAANPGYLVYADQYMGTDGFAVSVSPIENPTVGTFEIEEGKTVTAKQYFKVLGQSDCDLGNHSWAEVATVDKAATCTEDGQKSIKCTVCKTVKDGTVEVIPATHTWGGYTVDTIATAFSEGLSRWTCSVCRDVKTEPIAKTTPRVGEHNQVSDKRIDSYNYDQLKDIMGDSHFYPTEADPDGNDLLIELSILFNESMNNYIDLTTNLTLGGIFSDSKLTDGKNTHWFHFKGTKAGSFDFQDEDYEIVHGPELTGDFLSNRLDGWHRFGIRYHQNTVRDGDTFTYSMTVTLYIDGVRVHEYILNNDKGTYTALLLYTAEVVDGEIKYTEYTDKYAGIFRFNNVVKNVDDPAYFIYADHKVSCADDFYLNVSPVTNPEAKDYVVNDDVTFSGKEYFTVNGLKDCDLGNHSWAGKATTDKAATCTEDGSKSIKCTVCGAVKPDSTTTIPAAHAWGAYTTDVEATCTENGQKSIKCLTCKETKPGSVETIESAGQHVLGADAVITTTATVFTEGVKTGTCTACGAKNVSVVFEGMTKAAMNPITGTTSGNYITEIKKIGDVVDGQLLHPTTEDPNGKDILIEYSVLFNSTMDMFGTSNFTLPGVYFDDSKGKRYGDGFFTLYVNGGNKGFFEMYNSRCNEVENGYVYGPHCDFEGDDLEIAGFDGWHRIGVRIHTDAYVENGKVYYVNTVTLYIDGVRVQEHKLRTDDNCSNSDHTNADSINSIIWAGSVKNGEITSYENYDSRYVTAFRLNAYLAKGNAGKTAYFPVADIYYSCGDDFVLDVSPVENPEAKDFTQDGVTLSGKQYFTVNN